MSARLSAGETTDPPPADLTASLPPAIPSKLVDEAREEVKKFLLGQQLFLKTYDV